MATSTVCTYCGFTSTSDLGRRNHINKRHRDLLTHACRYCPLKFDTERAVRTHMGFKHKGEGFVRNKNRPEVQREWNLRKNYGIGIDDYERLLVAQGGRCACCDADRADRRREFLHVDHDHVTGAVRGLLCSNCNRALGNVHDDADRLRRLADYLDERGR